MKPKFAVVAVAAVAVISGCGVTQASVIRSTVTRPSPTATAHPAKAHSAKTHPAQARPAATSPSSPTPSSSPSASADPSLTWLESAGGQEQVTFNDGVSTLAGDLDLEDQSPTVANHLAFEADARAVRAEADKILSTPSLLPTVNRAAYEQMLNDFITVANLLQPGPGYGTTAQDWSAWNTALAASNITVS
jgi:hypothetical protein